MKVFGICASLLFAACCFAQQLDTLASDDVWCYVHSLNPTTDPYMRVWGDGIDAIHPCPPDFYHSFSYVKFALTPTFDASKNYAITSAKLILTHASDPGFTVEQGLANPLRAYSLGDAWSEGTWDFSQVGIGIPCPMDPYFGEGDLSGYVATTDKFPIPIDLAGPAFSDYFNESLHATGKLDLALCSTIAPGDQGGVIFYKLVTKDHVSGLGPRLQLVATPAKTVAGTVELDQYLGPLNQVALTFEVRQPGSQVAIETHTVMLDAQGNYQFGTAQSGPVDIACKGPIWLRQVQGATIDGGPVTVNFSLTGGDADGNNAVELKDFNTVLINFSQSVPDGDVNGSGMVDLKDFNMVLINFAQIGAP